MLLKRHQARCSHLSKFRDSAELLRAKRIILTGYTDMDVILDTINECQIFKFILKPFDQHDLALTVSRALEAFELEARLEAHRKELEQKVEERTREA